MEAGKSPDTPVAVVQWCSRARQQTVKCTLDTLEQVVGEGRIRPPSVFVVGKVVSRAPSLSWFQERPLFGTTVLVAGSRPTATRLRERLALLGAEVLTQPTLRITEPADWTPADAALERLDQYDWLVFSSGSGVDGFMGRLFSRGKDVRALAPVRIAALGQGTAERLKDHHVRADLTPDRVDTAALARQLAETAPGGAVLLVRASGDRPALADELESLGAAVDQIAVYQTVEVETADPDVADALRAGEVSWITVTSGPTARALVRLYGDLLSRAGIVSISPLTSATLRSLGVPDAAEAVPHTVDGLVETILKSRGLCG